MTLPSTEGLNSFRFARLVTVYAFAVVALSLWNGLVIALQFGAQLNRFDAIEFLPAATLTQSVREIGPATSAWAALLAAIIWTHPAGAGALRLNLRRAAPLLVAIAVAGAPVAIALVAGCSLLTARWVYETPWERLAPSSRIFVASDIPTAVLSFVVDIALGGVFAWFALPAMTRRSWPLAWKIGAIWAASVVLRIAAAVAGA